MSLLNIISMREVEKEIGKGRAKRVRKFRKLVDERRYDEARKFYQEDCRDLASYAEVHLRELKMHRNGF